MTLIWSSVTNLLILRAWVHIWRNIFTFQASNWIWFVRVSMVRGKYKLALSISVWTLYTRFFSHRAVLRMNLRSYPWSHFLNLILKTALHVLKGSLNLLELLILIFIELFYQTCQSQDLLLQNFILFFWGWFSKILWLNSAWPSWRRKDVWYLWKILKLRKFPPSQILLMPLAISLETLNVDWCRFSMIWMLRRFLNCWKILLLGAIWLLKSWICQSVVSFVILFIQIFWRKPQRRWT